MSRFDDPVILSCSISGVIADRDQCPAIPYTPEEYASEARRAVEEGAAQIHIHARRPDGAPSYEVEDADVAQSAVHASTRFGTPNSSRASATLAVRLPTSSAIRRAFAMSSPFERAISPFGR